MIVRLEREHTIYEVDASVLIITQVERTATAYTEHSFFNKQFFITVKINLLMNVNPRILLFFLFSNKTILMKNIELRISYGKGSNFSFGQKRLRNPLIAIIW